MASPARCGFPARKNSRLDAFLRRHLPPEVYDAVRAYEQCIVLSDSEKHTLKYVVLTDRLIYLTENPPKSIRRVVALRDIVAIDLIDDYPEFLSPPDRETNQHIRIIYYTTVLKKECEKSKGVRKFLFPFHHANANNKKGMYHQESSTASKDSTLGPPSDLKKLSLRGQRAGGPLPNPSRTSCQLTSTSSKASGPFCITDTKEPQGLSDHKDSLSEIPFKCNGNGNEFYLGNSTLASPLQSNPNLEKKESELHLYVISTTSSIFLHLKSSWNNYIIEKIKHFGQLKSELFLKDNTLRKILCLIMELKVTAQKNFILKRLFWKTSDLFYFLVNKLHEYLPESRDKNALHNRTQRADELVVCIEIIQTLGWMFRETETESLRLNILAAKKGTLFNLLVILISEPQIPKSGPVFDIQLVADSTSVEMSFDAEITFVASIVKQVVKGLSASFQLLSPGQAVLLYQQFYILKSCLQYSKTLAEYIRNNYREEFRYFIHMPALEKRLPLCYPITQPTTQLFHEVLKLVEQKQ
ncbi:hypothetical protein MG293_002972, partial [Ovis ammon polii]